VVYNKNVTRLLVVSTVRITIEYFLLPYGEYFRSKGWKVDAAAKDISKSEDAKRIFNEVWDVSWSRSLKNIINLCKSFREIRKIVKCNNYDIIHVHTPIASFITRFSLKGQRKRKGFPKIIYTVHGFHFYKGGKFLKNLIYLLVEKLAGRWTDILVVMNKEDKHAALKFKIVPARKLHYIPGIGIDLNKYDPDKIDINDIRNIRRELNLLEKDNLFLMIAEFNKGKRHYDAIKALAYLNDPSVHLAFAGLGPLLELVKLKAKRLGVEKQVHFLGFRRDIPILILASLATILTSEREGLPRCVLESLSLGVPVIGYDIRGVRDILERGGGLLVKKGRYDEMAKAMSWLIEHHKEAKNQADVARCKMDIYDLNKIIKQYEDLYISVLNIKYN